MKGSGHIASEAKLKANDKYLKNKTDTIIVRVPKGKKDELQVYVKKQGKSLNGFINEAINEKIKRDNKKD